MGREFNTGTSNINTPNIATEDDAYEFVFKETDFGTEATVATTTIEDTEHKTIHNIEMELVEDTDLTENVWGADSFGVFESNDFGLCAPANLVEGAFNAFDDLIEDDASENVTVVSAGEECGAAGEDGGHGGRGQDAQEEASLRHFCSFQDFDLSLIRCKFSL